MLASILVANAALVLGDWGGFVRGLLLVGFLICCVLLILTILIQKPQGGGLAGAFGAGSGSGQTAFGTRTGDALTIFTVAVFVIYLFGAVGLSFAMRPSYDLKLPTEVAPAEGDAGKAPATGAAGDTTKAPAAPSTPASPSTDKAPANPPTTPTPPAPGTSTPVPPFPVPEPAPSATPPATTPATAPGTAPKN